MEVLLNGLMLVFSQVENLVLKNKSGHLQFHFYIRVSVPPSFSGFFWFVFLCYSVLQMRFCVAFVRMHKYMQALAEKITAPETQKQDG